MNIRSAIRVTGFSLTMGFFGQNATMLTGNENAYKGFGVIAHLYAAATAVREGNPSYMVLSVVGALLGELIAYQTDLFSSNYSQQPLRV